MHSYDSPYYASEETPPPFEIDTRAPALELAIIIPTLNERANVPILLERPEQVLQNVCWEVVFVDDDSRDGTAALIRSIAARKSHVHVIQRIGHRGLSSACIEGMLATGAPVLAVMDADLQHDLLPETLEDIQAGGIDLAIASRYTEGGSLGDFSDSRARISRVATRVSRLIVKADLADTMSGFS
jgi:dolichol-phosphate mannosyltransferase